MKLGLAVIICIAAAGCGGSGSNPNAPDTPRVLEGQTVSAIDGTGTGVVTIQVGSHHAIQTDGDGNFQVEIGGLGTYAAVVSGDPVVERHTTVTGPTANHARIALIPATFDLQAFDQMFRAANNRLQRWTTRPPVVVVATVMKYVNSNSDRYEATGEQLTDDEVTTLVMHLNEGVSLLTAGTFPSFASVEIERPRPGEQVNVRRLGKIVIGRYVGISTLAYTIGYGTWAEQPDGAVIGGSVWLDRDFDRDDARRRLLRIHELGHALGYNHVTVRPSVMNPAIGPEPTDFDRAGASIAFQRPIGNTSPDTDPAGGARTFAVNEGGARWSAPIQ